MFTNDNNLNFTENILTENLRSDQSILKKFGIVPYSTLKENYKSNLETLTKGLSVHCILAYSILNLLLQEQLSMKTIFHLN